MRQVRRQPVSRPSLWARFKGLFARSSVYEGASDHRTRRGWTKSNIGPNAAAMSAVTLRARARDLVRNDAHASRAVTVVAGTTVGTGIEPRFKGAASAKIKAEWKAWSKRADVSGKISLDALQLIAMRAVYQDGECFVVRRVRRSARLGFRIEVLEADMLDETITKTLADGSTIVQGVEFDADGECVAYHFRKSHPGESAFSGLSMETVRIAASNVIHVYMPLRPQQVRGITWLAPSMTAKVDLADFERFHLLSKKMESMIAGFIIPGDEALRINSSLDPDPDVGIEVSALDVDGNAIERLEPGMLASLSNGKDIKFNTPILVQGYDTFKASNLQTISVGWGLTYELLTGDLSKVNYSSLRAGMLEFWRFIDSLQWQMFIPTFCEGVERWFAEAAVLSGVIRSSEAVEVEWVPPKRAQVDPSKDLLADFLRVRGGLAPFSSVVQEHGWSVDEIVDDWSVSAAALDAAGVVLDIDPRRYQWRGAAPVNVTPLPEPPATPE